MKRLRSIIARVLTVDEGVVTDAMSPETVETWDSFNALLLVSELEDHFGVQFTMDEVVAVKCVRDIKDALRRHDVEICE